MIDDMEWTDAGTIVRHGHTWRRTKSLSHWSLDRKLLNHWVPMGTCLTGADVDYIIERNDPVPLEVFAEALVDAVGEILGVDMAGNVVETGQIAEAQEMVAALIRART